MPKLENLNHQYDQRLRDAKLRMTTTTTTWKQQLLQRQQLQAASNRHTYDVTGSFDVVIQQLLNNHKPTPGDDVVLLFSQTFGSLTDSQRCLTRNHQQLQQMMMI